VTEYGHALRAIAFFNQRQFLIFFLLPVGFACFVLQKHRQSRLLKKRRKIPEPGGG
jgi:hypothetical protein